MEGARDEVHGGIQLHRLVGAERDQTGAQYSAAE